MRTWLVSMVALVIALSVRCDAPADAQVSGWNLFAPSLSTRPAGPLNLIAIGDSIAADYLGTNPPSTGVTYSSPLSSSQTGWLSVAGYTLQSSDGYTVSLTDYGQTGSATWQWLSNTGAYARPSPAAGKTNIAIFCVGTNDLGVYSNAAGGQYWTSTYSYTPIAYVLAQIGGSGNYYIFRTATGGTSGNSVPAWSLSGNVTDGTVTWALSSTSQLLTDIETNYEALTTAYHNAGWTVIASPILPSCASQVPNPPLSQSLRIANTSSWASWLLGIVGTNGITSEQRWDLDTTMYTPGIPTACSNTTYYHTDGVHPTDAGHALLATWTVSAILAL